MGIAVFLYGTILDAAGYDSENGTYQTEHCLNFIGYEDGRLPEERTLWAIRICLATFPSLLLIFSLVCAYLLPITKKTVTEVQQKLNEVNSDTKMLLETIADTAEDTGAF